MPKLFYVEDLLQNAPLLLQGLANTVFLSALTAVTAFVLGLGLATVRFYRIPVASSLASAYVTLARSIPVIMLIALVHFALLPMLGIQNSFFLSAFVALTMATTAYFSEILRGGYHAIRREEMETSVSLGLNGFQQLLLVLMPLAVTRMTPALVNQCVTLIKDTSLASVIGVIELTRSAEIIYERTFHEVTLLLFVALVYFTLCYALSRWAGKLQTCASLE